MMFHIVRSLIFLSMFIPMSTSFNSTLQLYNSFAEIYQEYKGPLRFEQIDWDNIKHESIKLRSTINHTITFERRVIRINMNMTGRLFELFVYLLIYSISFR